MTQHRLRVFILGAGVSASCGIAVTGSILRRSVALLAEQRRKELDEFLEFLYPSFDRLLKNYPNLEDFLNLVEMALIFNRDFVPSDRWPEERLKRLRRTTLDALTRYLWNATRDSSTLTPLRDYSSRLFRPGNVVITFNWDLTLERAWSEHDDGPDLDYSFSGTPDRRKFYLLKPHGSIDWFERRKLKGTPAERRIQVLDKTLCYYPYFRLSKDPELLHHLPVIVPPVSSKRFMRGFLNRVWASVYKAVSQATELRIIGYSLPKEDQFARFVFRRALRNNVVNAQRNKKLPLGVLVVNPDENVEGTFARLVGSTQSRLSRHSTSDVCKFAFVRARFQDYIATP